MLSGVAVIADSYTGSLLGQVQGGDGVLAHSFLILLVQFRILILDDLAQPNLGQLLGNKLLVEQTALDGRLVLHEGGNHLVQVLAADACGFRTLGFGEALDLDLENAAFLVETDVALVRIIAARPIVEVRRRDVGRVLGFELEARGQNLFHEQAGGDSLQGVVHGFGHCRFGGVRLRD